MRFAGRRREAAVEMAFYVSCCCGDVCGEFKAAPFNVNAVRQLGQYRSCVSADSSLGNVAMRSW